MALIVCEECGRQVSDRAVSCPGCGCPVCAAPEAASGQSSSTAPTSVAYDSESDTFTGTTTLVVQLAVRAIQDLGWKVDQTDATVGLVSFQTAGISWGSWSGISGSLHVQEVTPHSFRVSGTAKQNPSGLMRVSLDVGGEAGRKIRTVIERMRQMITVEAIYADASNDCADWIPQSITDAYDGWERTRGRREFTRFLNSIEASFASLEHGEGAASSFAARFPEAHGEPGFQAWVRHIAAGK